MADEALRERLKTLRSGNKPSAPVPTPAPDPAAPAPKTSGSHDAAATESTAADDDELFRRLKALKGISTPRGITTSIRPSNTPHVPARTVPEDEQDQIDELIRQTQQLVDIEGDSPSDAAQLDPSSDSDESIGAIEREAEEIIKMAHDEVALERQMGTIPRDDDAARVGAAVPSYGGVLHREDVDLEDELAEAAKDADFHAVAPRAGSGRTFRRARWTSRTTLFMTVALVVVFSLCAVPGAYAFGAGNIPSFSYLEGKAFRHGDLADTLSELARKTGGLLGSSKFSGIAIKRIYFGNWLRDYSQAMDVAALEKMPKQTILNIVMLLGFLAHGYATAEFEVTDERLGTYLPEEHLDNPKGYADGKDARQFDARLRGPVDPRELEIDPRSGMKNYLANESGAWPTGSALIRKTIRRCIDQGRRARQSGRDADLFEAYRLLGQALHTLEDLPAHSNWCELALRKLGYHQVFVHVGDNVTVQAPDGTRVAPLVTGTFGSADFIHSLLGEAQDHLSEASISDLSKAIDSAKTKSTGSQRSPLQDLLGTLTKIPGAGGDGVSRDLEDVSRGPSRDPAQMSPKEIYANMWKILELRDRIAKSIETTIEKIPGLSALVEKLTNELNIFVFTLIEPYAKPIMQQGMSALHIGSATVINKEDQFEVFTNPNASDPTHSMLSKDHFGLILNEVAGNVAQIIVRHTVKLVVKAWDDNGIDADRTADECLAPMFHPYWFSGRSEVQREMLDYMAGWARSHPQEIGRLDREHVRSHTNTRTGKAEPHNHGGDGPSISSFMGGSTSQAAHSFAPSGHHGSSGHQGGGGGGLGSSMANYASNYMSGQMHNAFGGGGGGGLFREGVPGGEPETGAGANATGEPSHGRYGSGHSQTASAHHGGESGSYYNTTGGGEDDERRHGHAPGSHGGGSSYGGGSVTMPDERVYSSQQGGYGGGGPGYPAPGGGYPGSGYPPAGAPGGYPGPGAGGFAPPPGPPGGMPMQPPFNAGPPGGYGQGPAPPFPPGPGGYGPPGGYGNNTGGGGYGQGGYPYGGGGGY
ncbi:uncharacterized protein PFL1_01969 [Pseudozyma flocculosa PF-1]|uniref:Related to Het-c heterokaryon incompatibility protein n=1 Tax=Pseudozyma flocculosa TaxID=84751 RepID=A0A5C3F076_9BASI|nr:uncharacterized protein PFL1_01969 [Pseudozyma flocculosa PF-1]EPQ30443.1 hypothetical protein PFL1_01969 [Pseudozyma flocculosa PF-1]SPO37520.1 related to Het-c heterokaryon incompatibility protein [Pseudozyma flocculosa]